MVRGDICSVYNWYTKYYYVYLYRIDPVPGIRKYGSYRFYKRPRHVSEKRAWFDSEGFGRAKRSPKNLQNPWDDYKRGNLGKSWKNLKSKHKHQWDKPL